MTINKIDPTHNVSGNSLTYNGSAQTLGTVTTNGGAVTYCATSNGTYSSTCPKQTNAGTYTTYYKIAESTNYKAYSGSFSTTIAKKKLATPTVTVSTAGIVTWGNVADANGYQISMSASSGFGSATSGIDYNSTITNATGSRTVYVRATNTDTTNFITSDNGSKTVTVYTVTFQSSNTNYGTVNKVTKKVISGVTVSTNNSNILYINGVTTGTTTKVLETVTATNKTGYHFTSWSKTSGSITANTTITATFAPNTNTPYIVKHYVHVLGDGTEGNQFRDSYTLNSTENKTGTTDSTVTIASLAKSIPGFTYEGLDSETLGQGYLDTNLSTTSEISKPTSGAVTTTTIAPDGSRVINLFYRRNRLLVRYHLNGGRIENGNNIFEEMPASDTVDYIATIKESYQHTSWVKRDTHWIGVYGGTVNAIGDANTYANADTNGFYNCDYSALLNIIKTDKRAEGEREWKSYLQKTVSFNLVKIENSINLMFNNENVQVQVTYPNENNTTRTLNTDSDGLIDLNANGYFNTEVTFQVVGDNKTYRITRNGFEVPNEDDSGDDDPTVDDSEDTGTGNDSEEVSEDDTVVIYKLYNNTELIYDSSNADTSDEINTSIVKEASAYYDQDYSEYKANKLATDVGENLENGDVTLQFYVNWIDPVFSTTNCGKNSNHTMYSKTLRNASLLKTANTTTITVNPLNLNNLTVIDGSIVEFTGGRTITLNLNGKTLTRRKRINVSGGTFTVKGSGYLLCKPASGTSEVSGIYGTNAVIKTSNNPTIVTTSGVIYTQGGTIALNTGTLISAAGRTAVNIKHFTADASITDTKILATPANKCAVYGDSSKGKNLTISGSSRLANGTSGPRYMLAADDYRNNALSWNCKGKLTITGDTYVCAGPKSENAVCITKKYGTGSKVEVSGTARLYALNTGKYCIFQSTKNATSITLNTTGYIFAKGKHVVYSKAATSIKFTHGNLACKGKNLIVNGTANQVTSTDTEAVARNFKYYVKSGNAMVDKTVSIKTYRKYQ